MNPDVAYKLCPSQSSTIFSLGMVIFIDTFAMALAYPLFAPLFSLATSQGGLISSNISLPIRSMLYGLTIAIYPIFMFFTSPLLGDYADRVGRKNILLFCLLGTGFGAALSGLAIITHNFTLFFISRMIVGGLAGSLPAAQAAISDISNEKDKPINLSLIGFAFTLGIVLGPICSGILSNKNIFTWCNFSTPFFITTILSICNAILLIFTFRETLTTPKQVNRSSTNILKPLIIFTEAWQNKSIRNIMITCFLYVLGWHIYLQFTPLYLFQRFNFTTTQLGYFASWVAIIMNISMLIIIRLLLRYYTVTQTLYLGIMLSILGISVALIPSISIQWFCALPIACGIGLSYTTIVTLFSNNTDAQTQGRMMGVSSSTMAAAAGIGGLLVGFMPTHNNVGFVLIIVAWVLCFLFLSLNNYKPPESN
jgi:MFS transporter, DHA1 family, tetracycline resistance protein